MDYNLLICVSARKWIAIDIDLQGNCDRISFDGNDSFLVESNELLLDFCTQILDYYNIDDFKDIELNIKIVVLSEYSELIEKLFFRLKGAKSINVIDAKSVIPVYVLQNCIVKPGSKMDIKCLEAEYSLQIDNNHMVLFTDEKAGNEIIIPPEGFAFLFRFNCKNLISDEEELKKVKDESKQEISRKQSEVDKLMKLIENYKNQKTESENYRIQLQKEKEELQDEIEKRIAEKRNILRASEAVYSTECGYEVLGQGGDRFWMFGSAQVYKCELLKSDGEVVEKGTKLIKIKKEQNSREYIITAPESGRIFYLVKNGDLIVKNDVVAVLASVADKKENIMTWFQNMKEEMCDEPENNKYDAIVTALDGIRLKRQFDNENFTEI